MLDPVRRRPKGVDPGRDGAVEAEGFDLDIGRPGTMAPPVQRLVNSGVSRPPWTSVASALAKTRTRPGGGSIGAISGP